jgi:PIN domain nuclease of toxin-antitoxin system
VIEVTLRGLAEPERLDATTPAALGDSENEVLFSAASLCRIVIKSGLGRPDFTFVPAQILQALDTGFVELPVRSAAAIHVAGLPPYHRDPFDRLLIAQAVSEPVRFYTAAPLLPPYSELVTLVG